MAPYENTVRVSLTLVIVLAALALAMLFDRQLS
jgi:hypothetical protein